MDKLLTAIQEGGAMRDLKFKFVLFLSFIVVFFYLGCGGKQENNIQESSTAKGVEMPQYTVYFFKAVDSNKYDKALDDRLAKGIRSDSKEAKPGEKFVGTVKYYGEGNVVLNITDKKLKKILESPFDVLGGGSEGEGEYERHVERWFTFQPGTEDHLLSIASQSYMFGYRSDISRNETKKESEE